MRKKLLCLWCFFLMWTLQAQEWTQAPKYTKVTFTIKNFGVNVDGNFDAIAISTNLNTNNLEASYINAEILVNSVTTGIKKRDKSLLKKGYFNENTYKKIQLVSTKIERDEKGTLQLFATLTIKGISKNIQVPLTVSQTENKITITSKFGINRRDFTVGGGSFILSKQVNIEVHYTGVR